jgi:hypothetical protein
MKSGIAWGLTLLLCAAAEADEPAPPQTPTVQAPRPGPATPVQRNATTASRPLNLRIGDVSKYMMPNEYRATMNVPDADKTTVIVQGERRVAPLQSELAQPVGLMAVYSLFRHPTSAWRLFVPDTSAYAPQPGPPDVVPPREFRWGP